MPALLFGSISTIADTSELQRQAFNDAFAAHGLDWTWDREDYQETLATSGGQARIAAHAGATGAEVDAQAVHRSKSELFQQSLAGAGIHPRPGVVETIHDARAQGFKVALVTTTSRENVDALLAALAPDVQRSDFDTIVDLTQVAAPKPDSEAYRFALTALGESAGECVAIEDNLGGLEAAVSAGVTCVAFPNENTAPHDFDRAAARVESLDFASLKSLAAAG